MQIVEIRLHSGLLLIGKPGAIPAVMLKASDEQKLKVALRTLALDSTAMTQVRRHWRKLLPAQSSTALTGTELARRLRSEIAAGRLAAVLLSEAPDVIEPAQLRNSSSAVVHVPMKNATLLLAPKGKLPPDLARQATQTPIGPVLRSLDPASASFVSLDRYAHRLPDGAVKQVSGSQLSHHIAWQIETGGYDSALLSNPGVCAMAAARPDAPIAVSRMTRVERIAEALSRCRRHDMSPDIMIAVEKLIERENLAIMAGVLAIVAIAQTNPATGAAVNTTLVAVGWIEAGLAGVMAIADLIVATAKAVTAEHEIDLDNAAQLYAAAFRALGSQLIDALISKFTRLRGGAPKNVRVGSGRNITSGTNRKTSASVSTASSNNPTPSENAVIGRMEDLKKEGAIQPNEYTIAEKLPNLGNPKANYYQNMRVMRQEMRRGVPIRDASALKPDSFPAPTADNPKRIIRQTFTGAERNLLRNKGWSFDGTHWNPPK